MVETMLYSFALGSGYTWGGGARMISQERLSALIGEIYDCAIDAALWPQTMESICRELDLRTGVISVISLEDGQPLLSATTGFEEQWLDKVSFYGEELVDMWGGEEVISSLPIDEPAVLSRVNPDAIAPQSSHPFHIEFNQPQGFVDAIAVGLTRDHLSVGSMGFNRHEDHGLVGPREIEIIRLLLPHLQRAATIGRVLEKHATAVTGFRSVLDSLVQPIVLVGADLTVSYENEAAVRLADRDGHYCIHDGRLVLTAPSAQKALEFAIRGSRAPAGDPFGIPLGSDGNLRSLHVLPLEKGTNQRGESADYALLLTPLTVSAEDAGKAVAALFGLTDAERRIFEAIADGLTVNETAARFAIGTSTVRTHLLRIYDKTGLHRQAELILLARQYTPTLAGRDF